MTIQAQVIVTMPESNYYNSDVCALFGHKVGDRSDRQSGSYTNSHTVGKVTVPTSTSGAKRCQYHPSNIYHVHTIASWICMHGAMQYNYFSAFKSWFTLRASASAVAPESPILFRLKLRKRVLQT